MNFNNDRYDDSRGGFQKIKRKKPLDKRKSSKRDKYRYDKKLKQQERSLY